MNEDSLRLCLSKIEEKLGWADSSLWMNQDFEILSDRIFEATNIRLSNSTLKRVWGKVNHQGGTSISTLNALALFIGYVNWSDFKNKNAAVPFIENKPKSKAAQLRVTYIVSGLAALAALSLLAFKMISNSHQHVVDSSVKFDSRPVTKGFPNSVIFDYDFGDVKTSDAKIQQSWNDKLTFAIDPKGIAATGIYYYPGYFRAKLLADGQILREDDVFLRTEGWMATHDDLQGKPRYFLNDELDTKGVMKIRDDVVDKLQKHLSPRDTLQIAYHYFDKVDSVMGDNFILDVTFRNADRRSNAVCQLANFLVHGTEAVFTTPFSIPGCVSNLNLLVAGKQVSGKTNDLSAFGTNMGEWQQFKLEIANETATYFLNGKRIRQEQVTQNIGRIVGLRFRFWGVGELAHIKLHSKDKVAFEEDFTQPLD